MNNKHLEYLKDLQLHKDGGGNYYLSAVYIKENERGIYETTIPKIHLPIGNRVNIDIVDSTLYYPLPTIDIGFGKLNMLKDKNGLYYVVRTIEEKVHDLTLSEIEKKLGYKVRVISEKEK